jgi:hypothetical protein
MDIPQIDRSQAVAITVTFKRLGDNRQGNQDEVKTSADKAMTRIVKKLFCSSEAGEGEKDAKCSEYEAIRSFDNQTYNWMLSQSVSLLGRRNVRLVKADAVQRIEEYLTGRVKERALLVEAFCKVYPIIIDNARSKLNGQFDAGDYLSVSEVASRFGMDWNYLALGVPENLPDAVKAVFAAKAEKDWQATAAEIRDGLRAGMVQLVDHLVERLNAKDTDKKARFHESTVDNVLQFIDALEGRNLTNDKALAEVAAKAKELIAGAKVDQIKTDNDMRRALIRDMAQVKVACDALLSPERRRMIDLD